MTNNKLKSNKVKKYNGGGTDLLGAIDPTIMKNLSTPFKSKMPATTTPAPAAPTNTGSNFQMPSLGGGGAQQTSEDPNAPKKKNIGKTIGSVVGGVAGSIIAPGIGTMIGSTIGGGIGTAIDNKTYQNKVEDYNATVTANKSSQQNALSSNIPGNFNPNTQTKQFKKGGELIKRADGSYSKRGLWDNIRANKGSGKAPTKAMLEQEAKIKAKMASGGKLPKDILKSRLESHMSSEETNKYLQEYKKGGIYIKPENRGKFTATKKATGKTTEELTHSKNPLTRKRAIFAQNAAKWHHAHGGIDTSNSMSGPKYVEGGMLKPMGNDMFEVKSYKKGTDKVEYRPNVFIDNKEIIRKNPDGSTQILSDDLGYAKVAKNIAKAKGGNITDEQFDQLYNAQEMSKTNKNKGNKYVKGGTSKVNLRNPMSDDRATLVSGLYNNFGTSKPKSEDFSVIGQIPQSNTGPRETFNQTENKIYTTEDINSNKNNIGNITNTAILNSNDKKAIQTVINTEKQRVKFNNPTENITLSSDKSINKSTNKPLDTKVNPLGYLSTLPSAAYDIGLGLKGGDPVNFERMNTKYQFADPRGAMAAASRGVTSAYNAAKNAARTTATSAGEYLANIGTLASKEGIEKASTLAGIKAQYDMANTQGLNQTNLTKDQYNAQAQMRESIARQEEQDAARGSISKGLAGLSQNTMSYMADVNANKTQGRFVDLINSGEYEFVEDANGRIKLVPKKGAKSTGVEITQSPTTTPEPAEATPAKK